MDESSKRLNAGSLNDQLRISRKLSVTRRPHGHASLVRATISLTPCRGPHARSANPATSREARTPAVTPT